MKRRDVGYGLILSLVLFAMAGAFPPQGPGPGNQMRFGLTRDDRVAGRRLLFLTRDWFYCYPPTGEIIRVPEGYVTDFASIPPIASGIVQQFGDQAEASVVHDWLFAVGQTGRFDFANTVFRFALREQGVPEWKASAMHFAVSNFGRNAYGRANEWNDHFIDVRTELRVAPWFVRPATAIVGMSPTRCAQWDSEAGPFARSHPSPRRP